MQNKYYLNKKREFWNDLKVGMAFNGRVSKIADYGMFVDLGLLRGLLLPIFKFYYNPKVIGKEKCW